MSRAGKWRSKMQNIAITYDYGDFVVDWNGRTGVMVLFSREGERLGVLPRNWTQEEAESVLRDEFGYVSHKKNIRAAVDNIFPFP
jgi:hypothetical protein